MGPSLKLSRMCFVASRTGVNPDFRWTVRWYRKSFAKRGVLYARIGCKAYESVRHLPAVTWQIRSLCKAFVRVSKRHNFRNLKKLSQYGTVRYVTYFSDRFSLPVQAADCACLSEVTGRTASVPHLRAILSRVSLLAYQALSAAYHPSKPVTQPE